MKHTLTRRGKILLALTLAASAVLISDFYGYLSSPRKASRRPASSATPVPQTPTPAKPPAKSPANPTPTPAPTKAPQSRLASPPIPDRPWQRDPFGIADRWRPRRGNRNDPFSKLKVSGIVRGPTGYRALINDFVVGPGEVIQGVRILHISKEGVLVEKDGETSFLRLVQE